MDLHSQNVYNNTSNLKINVEYIYYKKMAMVK